MVLIGYICLPEKEHTNYTHEKSNLRLGGNAGWIY